MAKHVSPLYITNEQPAVHRLLATQQGESQHDSSACGKETVPRQEHLASYLHARGTGLHIAIGSSFVPQPEHSALSLTSLGF